MIIFVCLLNTIFSLDGCVSALILLVGKETFAHQLVFAIFRGVTVSSAPVTSLVTRWLVSRSISKDASVEAGRAAEAPVTEKSAKVVAGHSA